MSTLAIKEEGSRSRRSLTLAIYRSLDVVIALASMIVCVPILLLAYLAIRVEGGGPAIFSQQRLGRDKRLFTVHKFRTMIPDADPEVHREYVEQLISAEQSPRAAEDGRNLYKLASDDRVTRVGRVLRKTSLDELPQLYDVLRGHMSLVGPRPVIPYEAELYPADYDRRFALKPGLTGLWQVNGRNECSYHQMIALDVAWVDHHSVWRYLAILARTPWVLVRCRGVA
jgi:lipopolysaccharide/colanic/teichoic acid biosynthesis glycosyltransferase